MRDVRGMSDKGVSFSNYLDVYLVYKNILSFLRCSEGREFYGLFTYLISLATP